MNRLHVHSAIFGASLGAMVMLAYARYTATDAEPSPAPNLVPYISVIFTDSLSPEQHRVFTKALQTATMKVEWLPEKADSEADSEVDWSECEGDGCGALFPGEE